MRKLILAGLVAAVAAGASAGAQAQTADQAIAARKAGLQLMANISGAMKRAVDAKAEVKPFKGGADAMANWAAAMPGLFPAGSDKGNTKVLPVAFTDRAGFEKAAAALGDAAKKLSAAADSGDAAAFAAAYADVGKACGGCHQTYRAR